MKKCSNDNMFRLNDRRKNALTKTCTDGKLRDEKCQTKICRRETVGRKNSRRKIVRSRAVKQGDKWRYKYYLPKAI